MMKLHKLPDTGPTCKCWKMVQVKDTSTFACLKVRREYKNILSEYSRELSGLVIFVRFRE